MLANTCEKVRQNNANSILAGLAGTMCPTWQQDRPLVRRCHTNMWGASLFSGAAVGCPEGCSAGCSTAALSANSQSLDSDSHVPGAASKHLPGGARQTKKSNQQLPNIACSYAPSQRHPAIANHSRHCHSVRHSRHKVSELVTAGSTCHYPARSISIHAA